MRFKKIFAAVTALTLISCSGCMDMINNTYMTLNASETAAVTENNFKYEVFDDHAEVVSYEGCCTDIKIPETYEGLPVTTIKRYAFAGNETIKSVTVPASVNLICYAAFSRCSSLELLTILNPECRMDDNKPFVGSEFLSNYTVSTDSLSSLEKAGVNKTYNPTYNGIKDPDFYYNGKICGYFGSKAQEYADYCGYVFSPLDKPDENSVSSEDEMTFESYSDHAELIKCASDRQIIEIPDTYEGLPVTVVDENAFAECSSMRTLSIGGNVSEIKKATYPELPDSFTDIRVSQDNTDFTVIDDVLYNTDVTDIIMFPKAKYECTLPQSVTSVKPKSFINTKLTHINLPEHLAMIGDSAFENSSLSRIDFPDSLVYIGDSAFCGCSNLREVKLGDGVVSLGESAFSCCRKLTRVNTGNGLDKINDQTFSSCDELSSVKLGNNIKSIGESAFAYSEVMQCIEIPESVEAIKDSAFEGCQSMRSLTFFTEDIILGDNLFKNSSYIDKLYLRKTDGPYCGDTSGSMLLSMDGTKLIKAPNQVKDYTVPDTVTEICDYAFQNTRIQNIVIGPQVTKIGNKAFSSCENLENISILNPDCYISQNSKYASDTINNVIDYTEDPEGKGIFDGVIHCPAYSKAIDFAQKCSYKYEIIQEDESEDLLYGDVNVDADIDMSDLSELSLYCIGDIILDKKEMKNADVAYDGTIDLADLSTLKQFVMKDSVRLGPAE